MTGVAMNLWEISKQALKEIKLETAQKILKFTDLLRSRSKTWQAKKPLCMNLGRYVF